MRPLRIFIVDDHEVARRGVRDLLDAEDDFTVVGEADCVASALALLPQADVDVAVLDVRLPDGDGIELCRTLTADDPDLKCLMLTSFDDDHVLIAAARAGAEAFVVKQVRGDDITIAVRQVGAGRSLLTSTVVARAIARVGRARADDRALAPLSDQERRVLKLLVGGRTNRQVGVEMRLAEKTVKNYVSSVLTKLQMSSRTEAAVYAALVFDHARHSAHDDDWNSAAPDDAVDGRDSA